MKLLELLDGSAAAPAFRKAVHHFTSAGQSTERLVLPPNVPHIKVERALTKLVEEHPKLPMESAEISGYSGCELFPW
ncbi:MAG: hypothetical protein GEU90_04685 [Gemmatimonas sp.]|nr:hypothetical protein [Gemmatimonas sp.]